jgi:hypothetical protein
MEVFACLDVDHLQHEFCSYFLFRPHPRQVDFKVVLPQKQQLKKGCVIDVETTGLDPQQHHIVTMGVLEKDRAVIHQLTTSAYQEFLTYCIQKAQRTPLPRYGYNTRFESSFLNIKDGWHDLTQHAERRGYDWHNSDYPPYYRLRLDECTYSVFKEPNIRGADVPRTWQEWLNTHKPQTLFKIAAHNLSDLLRTRQLIGK